SAARRNARRSVQPRKGRKRLVPAGGLGVRPGIARGAVAVLDVTVAPLDLGRGVVLPVGTGAAHLRARLGLRDAVGAGGVGGVHVPAALPVPQVDDAAELRARAPPEARHQLSRDPLRLARGHWVAATGGSGLLGRRRRASGEQSGSALLVTCRARSAFLEF